MSGDDLASESNPQRQRGRALQQPEICHPTLREAFASLALRVSFSALPVGG